ncbi:hypothetical protein [Endothiovibrio diazotrophicus]
MYWKGAYVSVEAFQRGGLVDGVGEVMVFALSQTKYPEVFDEEDKQEALRLIGEAFVAFGKRFTGVAEVKVREWKSGKKMEDNGA